MKLVISEHLRKMTIGSPLSVAPVGFRAPRMFRWGRSRPWTDPPHSRAQHMGDGVPPRVLAPIEDSEEAWSPPKIQEWFRIGGGCGMRENVFQERERTAVLLNTQPPPILITGSFLSCIVPDNIWPWPNESYRQASMPKHSTAFSTALKMKLGKAMFLGTPPTAHHLAYTARPSVMGIHSPWLETTFPAEQSGQRQSNRSSMFSN